MRWSWLPWNRRARAARRAAAAQAVQDAEYRAARQRLLDVARRNAGPQWNPPRRTDRSSATGERTGRDNGGRH